ncbi:MAG: VWA domain-containing protein [Oligoflexales bacterium]
MRIWTTLLLALVALCCNRASFSGGQNKKPVPVEPICKEVTSTVGAHFLFLIDNSGSMRTTDCPDRDDDVCRGETNREIAIMRAYDELTRIYEQSGKAASSLSTISFVEYTPVEEDGFAYSKMSKERLGSTEAITGNRGTIVSKIQFVRQPGGDTPYLNAVDGGLDLVNEVNSKFSDDGKARVAVIVTDGEPTDRNPAAVRARAQELKGKGVKLFTIMVSAGGPRTDAHRERMLEYVDEYDGWYDAAYPSFDRYMQELTAIPTAISDRVILISEAKDLGAIIEKEVIKKSTTCQP